MKGKGSLIVGVLGVVSYLIYKGANKVTALNLLSYEIQSLKVRYHNFQAIFSLTIGIINPTEETFEFKNFVGELSLKGNRIAPINLTAVKGQPINPRKTSPLNMDIPVNLIDVPSIILELLPLLQTKKGTNVKPKKPIALDVTGLLSFKNFQLPVNHSITLT